MAESLYGRSYQITFIETDKRDPRRAKLTGGRTSKDNYNGPRTLLEDTLVIDSLDMTMKTELSTRSVGGDNKATITINNLSEDAALFASRYGNFVSVRAGYGDPEDLPIIFLGVIETAETVYKGPTRVSTFVAREASDVINGIRTSISIPPAGTRSRTTYADVFREIGKKYREAGINFSNATFFPDAVSDQLERRPESVVLKRGWTFDGFLKDALNRACRDFGFVNYILNDHLYLHPANFSKFSQATGVKLRPEIIKDIQRTDRQHERLYTKKSERGITMRTFLDGRIKPGVLIEVPEIDTRIDREQFQSQFGSAEGNQIRLTQERDTLSGSYTVRNLSYQLNTLTDLWDVVVVADSADQD